MAKKIVRINDTSDHGGYMITASGRFRNQGLNVCLDGDMHVCPIRGHGQTAVRASTNTVRSRRRGILRVGDQADCGATIITGSQKVKAA
jgi:uncharacterized Zn-binding protein involved in type VI secretion